MTEGRSTGMLSCGSDFLPAVPTTSARFGEDADSFAASQNKSFPDDEHSTEYRATLLQARGAAVHTVASIRLFHGKIGGIGWQSGHNDATIGFWYAACSAIQLLLPKGSLHRNA